MSDGFTDARSVVDSEASSTFPAFVSHDQRAAGKFGDDENPFVDLVVVNGEEFSQNKLLGSEKDTMTRQSPSETGSVHGGPDSRFASGQSNRSQSHASAYQRWWVYNFTRYRMWPAFVDFFEPTFEDDEQEAEYQKMKWHATKPTAL